MKILRHAETRGQKWMIEIQQVSWNHFRVAGFKNGKEVSCLVTADLIIATTEYERDIRDSAQIDGIHYVETFPNPAAQAELEALASEMDREEIREALDRDIAEMDERYR